MIRVLYIDDEEHLLEIGKMYLEESGEFSIATVKSARAALGLANLGEFDAIIADYQMPGMNGIELLRQIRASGNTAPFILFTGRGREEVVIQALNEGADFYLQKGGEADAQYTELIHKIRIAVRRHQGEIALRRSERALRASEERYRTVVEDQTELISRFLPDGTHLFVNEAYCRYFGMDRDRIIGQRFRPTLPDDDRARLERLIASLTPDHPVDSIEHRIIMPDGSVRWQRWNDRAIFDPSGTVIEFQSVGRDVTERKQSEDAMKQSERQYRDIFENALAGIYQVAPDSTLITVNNAFARIFGYRDAQEMLSAGINVRRDLYANEQERETVMEWILEHGSMIPQEIRVRRRDGTPFWILATAQSAFKPDGTLDHFEGMCIDITDQKEIQEQYRTLVDNALDPLLILDFSGTVLFANQAVAYLIGAEDLATLARRNVFDFIAPESKDAVIKDFSSVRTGRDGYLAQYEIITLSGRRAWVEAVGKKIEYRGVPADMVMLRDVTERKNADDALRASEEFNREIISSVGQGIIVYDRDLRIRLWNSYMETLTGIPAGEILGKNALEEFPFHKKSGVAGMLEHALQGTTSESPDFEYHIHSTGRRGWARGVYSPRYDTRGNILGAIGLVSDVTKRRQAEATLRANEEKYRALFNSTYQFTGLLTPAGVLMEANDTAMTFLGTVRGDVVNRPFWDTPWWRGNDRRMQQLRDAVGKAAAGQFVRYETELQGSAGTAVHVDFSLKPLKNSDGTVQLLIAEARDISDRKRTEDALRESEEKYRTLVNQVDNTIYIYQKDRFVFVNQKAAGMTGYSQEELLNMPFIQIVHPDDRERIRNIAERRMQGDTLPDHYEARIITKDGEIRHVEVTVSTIWYQGGHAGLGTVRDITKRRQFEDTLRASEEQYRALFNNAIVGIFQTDPDGTLIMANNAFARMYGFTGSDEMIRAKINVGRDLYASPEDRKIVVDLLRSSDVMDFHEFAVHTRDKKPLWVEVSARTIRNPDGSIRYFEGVCIDITERKRTEEALHQANRKLTLLNSITRHDIRNQLVSLSGYMNLSTKTLNDPQKTAWFIQKEQDILRAVERQILFAKEFGELGTGLPVWQDLRGCIERAAKNMDSDIVSWDFSGISDAEVFSSPLLWKVFFNLMDNSLRHGGPSLGNIRFSSQVQENRLVIRYEDDGTGIPAEEKDLIFGQGYGKNTGYGLFFVREVLDITQITISETGEPQKGARFEIVVPEGKWRPKEASG